MYVETIVVGQDGGDEWVRLRIGRGHEQQGQGPQPNRRLRLHPQRPGLLWLCQPCLWQAWIDRHRARKLPSLIALCTSSSIACFCIFVVIDNVKNVWESKKEENVRNVTAQQNHPFFFTLCFFCIYFSYFVVALCIAWYILSTLLNDICYLFLAIITRNTTIT